MGARCGPDFEREGRSLCFHFDHISLSGFKNRPGRKFTAAKIRRARSIQRNAQGHGRVRLQDIRSAESAFRTGSRKMVSRKDAHHPAGLDRRPAGPDRPIYLLAGSNRSRRRSARSRKAGGFGPVYRRTRFGGMDNSNGGKQRDWNLQRNRSGPAAWHRWNAGWHKDSVEIRRKIYLGERAIPDRSEGARLVGHAGLG